MAKFYVQLEDKLLKISGDLTAENISKALGYVPVSPNVTNELSQRVDNITFDSLKDNPFLQDGSGELNIVDEAGNIIAKIDAEGIHSVDFIAGEHRLSNKTDKTYVDEAVKNVKVDLTGYATEEWVENKNYLTEHQDISHLATKQEVSNIDFYNIKDNPIVNNGDGKLLFVDENGYIGLQLEEDGLYVKDVIADGHTLSQKADKSDIPSLDGYATESYVNTNLQNYATKDEVSDLVDMSVVTELQGKVDTLIGEDADKSVRDIAVDVLTETLVSETATEAYDTLAEMSAWIKSHPEDASAMNTAIQKNATDIQSNATAISNLDAAYKAADTKVLIDAQEYTDNINFYTIKDNPIVDNNDGNLTFVDESGNIGLLFSNNAILVNDVITPEHTLSSKADKSELSNYATKDEVPDLVNDKYTKPSTGIPFDDFEEQVQGSIIKAEESVQSISASVTTGSVTAGNFFKVNKDANGNVSIQMIQNTLASGKIAIPYTTDVKQYVDNAVANAGGGGGSTSGIQWTADILEESGGIIQLEPFVVYYGGDFNGGNVTINPNLGAVYQEFRCIFHVANAPTMYLGVDVWANGKIPEIKSNRWYELSIAFDDWMGLSFGVLTEFSISE